MHTRDSLPAASPLVRRQGKRQWEFRSLLQEIVFEALNTEHLKALLKEQLYSKPEYQDLPKYRILGLEDYLAGLLDAVARTEGVNAPTISLEKPKMRTKTRLSEKVEELRVGHATKTATTRPVPAWARSKSILDEKIEHVEREIERQESGPVVIRRRPAVEVQSAKPDPRAETIVPPAHRQIGGQRRTFRPARRLR